MRARFALAFIALAGCSTPDTAARTVVTPPPSRASFDPVGAMMNHACGTLDCHGNTSRNLRIYGREGRRVLTTDVPGRNPTTKQEQDLTYESLVALEPETMKEVVADRGKNPERLGLVRRTRGTEQHGGRRIFAAGEPGDRCIVSWLEGNVDVGACAVAGPVPY